MKIALLAGILSGFAAVIGVSGFYPWVDHPRLPSHTRVLPNGGRAERLVIRLPADQIVSAGTPEAGIRGRSFPDGVTIPEALGNQPLLLEHFKVRDVEGNVIGLAARHSTATAEGSASAWAITIPSRGTLWLVGAETPGALDGALASSGYVEGTPWNGDLRITISSGEDGSGRVASGTREFEGLAGTYSETWLLTGVGDAGELQGTVELSTITFRAP